MDELENRGHARRMGHLEDYFAILQRQKLYGNFNVYAELSEPITVKQLGQALRPLFLEHPLLSQYIVPKGYPNHESYYQSEEYIGQAWPEHDYIRLMDKVTLKDVILNWQPEHSAVVDRLLKLFREKGEYCGEMVEILGTVRLPICEPGKLSWRILLLSEEEDFLKTGKFVYISNHTCSDGRSAMNLFSDIAKHRYEVDEDGDEKEMVLMDYDRDYEIIGKMPIPINERLNYCPSVSRVPRFLAGSFARTKLIYTSRGAETRCVVDESEEPESFDTILRFSSEQVEQMKIAAKQFSNATLTPFLQTCLFVALYRDGYFFRDGKWNEWGIDVALPTDVRNWLPLDEELQRQYRFGNNVGGVHYFYLVSSFGVASGSEEEFWKLVRYYDENYRTAYGNGDSFAGLGILMSDVVVRNKNVDEIIRSDYCGSRRGGVLYSNLGVLGGTTTSTASASASSTDKSPGSSTSTATTEGGGGAGAAVLDLVFAQAPGAMKFSFCLNVASAANGMAVELCAHRDALPDRRHFHRLANLLHAAVCERTAPPAASR